MNLDAKTDESMNRAMRILMVDSEKTWRGGEAQLELLMKGLIAAGHRVALAAPPDAAITARAKALGIPAHGIAIGGGLDAKAAWKLRRISCEGSFDIIHTHSSHAHGVSVLACFGHPARPAHVVSRRVDFRIGKNPMSAWKYRRGADLFLAISRGVRDVLIRCGVSPEKIILVPSGIDFGKFERMKDTGYVRDEFSLRQAKWIVGNVAALAPHKAQVDFIDAAARVEKSIDGVTFLIVGEGKLRRVLESRAAEHGMSERIIFTGFREDPLEILSTFDCFVMSSRLEGLCTSIMDAQALGVPVVATEAGGIPDLIDHEKTGLLVPPAQPVELAEAILRMLTDSDLRSSCTRLAKEKAAQYDYQNMVKGTIAAYRTVSDRHSED
jgi:glycosyltransferase involved in cell wall biosynthesis